MDTEGGGNRADSTAPNNADSQFLEGMLTIFSKESSLAVKLFIEGAPNLRHH